jgi:hypothetical protein
MASPPGRRRLLEGLLTLLVGVAYGADAESRNTLGDPGAGRLSWFAGIVPHAALQCTI